MGLKTKANQRMRPMHAGAAQRHFGRRRVARVHALYHILPSRSRQVWGLCQKTASRGTGFDKVSHAGLTQAMHPIASGQPQIETTKIEFLLSSGVSVGRGCTMVGVLRDGCILSSVGSRVMNFHDDPFPHCRSRRGSWRARSAGGASSGWFPALRWRSS